MIRPPPVRSEFTGLREPEKKCVRMKVRRGIIRAVFCRSRRLPHLRHLWDPPGGAESESAKRDATVRDNSEGQRATAPVPAARAPHLHREPPAARREAGANREERERSDREERDRTGRREREIRQGGDPARPRRSCLSRGPGQPHPGAACRPGASRLSPPPSLGCPGRGALVPGFLAVLPKEKLHLATDSLQQVLNSTGL